MHGIQKQIILQELLFDINDKHTADESEIILVSTETAALLLNERVYFVTNILIISFLTISNGIGYRVCNISTAYLEKSGHF